MEAAAVVESEGMVTEVYQESEDEEGEGGKGEGEGEEGEGEEGEDEEEEEEESEVEEEMVGNVCPYTRCFTVSMVMFFRDQRSAIVKMTERTWRKRNLTSR